MFPPDHGEALAEEIPDAQLLLLDRAGHGVARVDWEPIVHRDPRTHLRAPAALMFAISRVKESSSPRLPPERTLATLENRDAAPDGLSTVGK